MKKSHRLAVMSTFLLSGALFLHPQERHSNLELFAWERGLAFQSPVQSDMRMYIWFYEHNMFEARRVGQHTGGTYELPKQVSESGTEATVGTKDLLLTAKAGVYGADLTLSITNESSHDWPELAGIIPCFNPGPKEIRNQQFANRNTYFYGPKGLERLQGREIHFASALRTLLNQLSPEGRFAFSYKWPTSPINARDGIIVRESTDGKWVTGMAWEDFLSAQGHNPWECMHLCIRVGPLKRGERRIVRGKVYLFQGRKEDCFKRYLADF